MNTNLYEIQEDLEEQSRGETIRRFHNDHSKASKGGTFSETTIGHNLMVNYINQVAEAVEDFTKVSLGGSAGRNHRTAKYINSLDPATVAYLTVKGIINKLGLYDADRPNPITLTSLGVHIGVTLHDELKCRALDAEQPHLSKKIHKDFDQRELLRYKRIEHLNTALKRIELEWEGWSQSEMAQVGITLVDLFQRTTGDIEFRDMKMPGRKQSSKVVVPCAGLVTVITNHAEHAESLLSVYMPMVVPPVPWSAETLRMGGYVTGRVRPYSLVKRKNRAYYDDLEERARAGKLDRVFTAVNAVQETAWQVNKPILEIVRWAWEAGYDIGKMPPSDHTEPEPLTEEVLALPKDHPKFRAALQRRAIVHEANRRSVGARTMAARVLMLATKFSQFDEIYFPHDIDSRGRVYPRPVGLNPQGPDYVKALLQFAEGKALGDTGCYWLGVHGANSWGHDKCSLDERFQWAIDHLDTARRVASDPRGHAQDWLGADNPCQYLAWCIEWAAAFNSGTPETFVSHLHVDLDATCSGLQHFSAMLRDDIGGKYVNMVPSETREDVYQAVADATTTSIAADLGGNRDSLARAWGDFGIDRKITKRPVMVTPYAGTRTSCVKYVSEAIDERLANGAALPWPESDLPTFKLYAAEHVWNSIPTIVVAANGAMRWLMAVTKLVAKSNPEGDGIRWTTPVGLPVTLAKFAVGSRQIKTFLDGNVFRPRLNYDTDKIDGRKLATTVAPSFVHALDAAHLVETVALAVEQGMDAFAVVHDSFGVHACDVAKFSYTIRTAFLRIYQTHDVLEDFLEDAKVLMSSQYHADIPPMPPRGDLEIEGILQNQFFFS